MGRCNAKPNLALAAALFVLGGCGGTGPSATPPAAAATGCGQVTAAASETGRQIRAMWITTVGNGDWPSRPGLPVAEQKAQFRHLLDVAEKMRLNTVYVQVRPTADAFYPSPYEPWSAYLTGRQGRNPGYDPLKFMIDEVHARGMEFHAWFNPYRVSTQPDLGRLAPSNPAREHPGWVHRYGDALWYDPGLPQVRDLITKVVLDVVHRYDIDGVHFDDYFYPYPVPGRAFPDQATFKKYGAGFGGVAAWRRHNVDTLIQDLSRRIHQARPGVEFGVSPFGVWRNRSDDPNGSATHALRSYDDIYADSRRWVKKNWIDYVVPQLYWPIGYGPADYRTLVAWWARQVAGTHVRLVIGQAAYEVGRAPGWSDPAELDRHVTIDRKYPQVRGEAFFSARDLAENRGGFAARVLEDHFERPAVAPADRGAAGDPPAAPAGLRARNARLSWKGSGGADAYAIYRAPGHGPACIAPSGDRLVKVVGGRTHQTVDATARPGHSYTYYVTALDRDHRESPPTRGANTTIQRG